MQENNSEKADCAMSGDNTSRYTSRLYTVNSGMLDSAVERGRKKERRKQELMLMRVLLVVKGVVALKFVYAASTGLSAEGLPTGCGADIGGAVSVAVGGECVGREGGREGGKEGGRKGG
jgi:hypothetical protein